MITSITAKDLATTKQKEPVAILNGRRASKYNSEHILNAINMPLDYIKNSIKKLDKEKTYYVHCRTGYRSMAFVSILKSMGF